jgi:hypothetical protein
MLTDWKGKIAGRPWVRTLSQGIAQVFTRVLGTTVVGPATPRLLRYSASRSVAPTYQASQRTLWILLASE